MRETLEFTIDVIEVMPENSICHIQAPSVNNMELIDLLQQSKYNWARQIILTSENKMKLKKLLLKTEVEEEFNNVTIEKNSRKLFEGFDGMEIGTISKTITIPDWFNEKYVETNYCGRSQEW